MDKFYQRGLSLVEIAIVVVLIAAVVTGVILGGDMRTNAQRSEVISEMNQYKTAYLSFKEKYEMPPGDLSDASSHWSSATDGNGNNYITSYAMSGSDAEELNVWHHLSLSGYIKGTYDNNPVGGFAWTINSNVPAAAMGNYGLYTIVSFDKENNGIATDPSDIEHAGKIGLVLTACATPLNPLGYCDTIDYGVMTSRDAYFIDKKMDDGKPKTGAMSAQVAANFGGHACSQNDEWNLDGHDYGGPDIISCRLVYFVEY